ncbi:16366_t:CDS:2 [Funneliformis mosseae]|uniref:16366_t:CDS:1 n=1 Tax=Funneliformis mosseae TaxID=27381 RepID=A0A9N9CMR2_FUNMO|nr:16366_t:CDS:2 [Funneliformis mosseae]
MAKETNQQTKNLSYPLLMPTIFNLVAPALGTILHSDIPNPRATSIPFVEGDEEDDEEDSDEDDEKDDCEEDEEEDDEEDE